MKSLVITGFFEVFLVLVEWYVCTGIPLPLYWLYQYKKRNVDRIELY